VWRVGDEPFELAPRNTATEKALELAQVIHLVV